MSRGATAVDSFGSKVKGSLRVLTSWQAAITGVGALGALGIGVKLAADFEQAEVAMSTMLGSTGEAKKVLKDLTDFAASTPFEFPELQQATTKLLAFGESSESVIPALRRIGDIAAGVGQPVGEIAEVYGKARVQGRLFAEDINQLVGRGIPVIQELAKQFGVTDGEVKKLVESGKVNFSNLEQAFISLTSEGGKFAGLMAAQSGTLSGLFSTLKDNVGLSLREISSTLLGAFDIKGLMQSAIAQLDAFNQRLKDSLPAIKAYVEEMVAKFREIAPAIQGTIGVLFDVVKTIGPAILGVVSSIVSWVAKNKELVADIVTLSAVIYAAKKAVDLLTASYIALNLAQANSNRQSLLTSAANLNVGSAVKGLAGALIGGVKSAGSFAASFAAIIPKLLTAKGAMIALKHSGGLLATGGKFLIGALTGVAGAATLAVGVFGTMLTAWIKSRREATSYGEAINNIAASLGLFETASHKLAEKEKELSSLTQDLSQAQSDLDGASSVDEAVKAQAQIVEVMGERLELQREIAKLNNQPISEVIDKGLQNKLDAAAAKLKELQTRAKQTGEAAPAAAELPLVDNPPQVNGPEVNTDALKFAEQIKEGSITKAAEYVGQLNKINEVYAENMIGAREYGKATAEALDSLGNFDTIDEQKQALFELKKAFLSGAISREDLVKAHDKVSSAIPADIAKLSGETAERLSKLQEAFAAGQINYNDYQLAQVDIMATLPEQVQQQVATATAALDALDLSADGVKLNLGQIEVVQGQLINSVPDEIRAEVDRTLQQVNTFDNALADGKVDLGELELVTSSVLNSVPDGVRSEVERTSRELAALDNQLGNQQISLGDYELMSQQIINSVPDHIQAEVTRTRETIESLSASSNHITIDAGSVDVALNALDNSLPEEMRSRVEEIRQTISSLSSPTVSTVDLGEVRFAFDDIVNNLPAEAQGEAEKIRSALETISKSASGQRIDLGSVDLALDALDSSLPEDLQARVEEIRQTVAGLSSSSPSTIALGEVRYAFGDIINNLPEEANAEAEKISAALDAITQSAGNQKIDVGSVEFALGGLTDNLPDNVKAQVEKIRSTLAELENGGLSQVEIDIAIAKQDIISSAPEELKSLLEQNEKAKQALREKDEQLKQSLASQAQSVFDSTRTPLENYESKLGDLSNLLNSGAIDWDTYGRAVRQAQESLNSSGPAQAPELQLSGSVEAQRTQFAASFEAKAGKREDEQVEIAKKQYEETKGLRQDLRNNQGGGVTVNAVSV